MDILTKGNSGTVVEVEVEETGVYDMEGVCARAPALFQKCVCFCVCVLCVYACGCVCE